MFDTFKLRQKRCAVIVTLKAQQRDTQIARFLKVNWYFIIKVLKELEATDGDLTAAA